jgi:hypothetical protein
MQCIQCGISEERWVFKKSAFVTVEIEKKKSLCLFHCFSSAADCYSITSDHNTMYLRFEVSHQMQLPARPYSRTSKHSFTMLNAVQTTSCSTNFQAGTWEEKNLTGWGKDRVKELMKELEEVSFPGGCARVTEVASCSGEVSSLDGHIIVQIILYKALIQTQGSLSAMPLAESMSSMLCNYRR